MNFSPVRDPKRALVTLCGVVGPHLVNDFLPLAVGDSLPLFWVLDCVVYLLTPLCFIGRSEIHAILTATGHQRYGCTRASKLGSVLLGGLLGLILSLLAWAVIWPTLNAVLGDPWGWGLPLPHRSALAYWPLVLYASVSAGFVEEIAYRASVPRTLRLIGVPGVSSMLMSLGIFGLIHWGAGPRAMVHALLLGIAFQCMKKQSIWIAMAAHTVYDVVAISGAWSWLF